MKLPGTVFIWMALAGCHSVEGAARLDGTVNRLDAYATEAGPADAAPVDAAPVDTSIQAPLDAAPVDMVIRRDGGRDASDAAPGEDAASDFAVALSDLGLDQAVADAQPAPVDLGSLDMSSADMGDPCVAPRISLRPIRFLGVGGDWGRCDDFLAIPQLQVFLRGDDGRVSEMLLPCVNEGVDFPAPEPGSYELALRTPEGADPDRMFFVGLRGLDDVICPSDGLNGRICAPIALEVQACSSMTVPVDINCHELEGVGDDVCGGG
jgi:hypothetical protein